METNSNNLILSFLVLSLVLQTAVLWHSELARPDPFYFEKRLTSKLEEEFSKFIESDQSTQICTEKNVIHDYETKIPIRLVTGTGLRCDDESCFIEFWNSSNSQSSRSFYRNFVIIPIDTFRPRHNEEYITYLIWTNDLIRANKQLRYISSIRKVEIATQSFDTLEISNKKSILNLPERPFDDFKVFFVYAIEFNLADQSYLLILKNEKIDNLRWTTRLCVVNNTELILTSQAEMQLYCNIENQNDSFSYVAQKAYFNGSMDGSKDMSMLFVTFNRMRDDANLIDESKGTILCYFKIDSIISKFGKIVSSDKSKPYDLFHNATLNGKLIHKFEQEIITSLMPLNNKTIALSGRNNFVLNKNDYTIHNCSTDNRSKTFNEKLQFYDALNGSYVIGNNFLIVNDQIYNKCRLNSSNSLRYQTTLNKQDYLVYEGEEENNGEIATDKGENATEREENATERVESFTDKEENVTDKEENATEREENATERVESFTDKEENVTDKEENATDKVENATERIESVMDKGENATRKISMVVLIITFLFTVYVIIAFRCSLPLIKKRILKKMGASKQLEHTVDENEQNQKTNIQDKLTKKLLENKILIDKSLIEKSSFIGKGNFGCVYLGWLNYPNKNPQKVALKTIKEQCKLQKQIKIKVLINIFLV